MKNQVKTSVRKSERFQETISDNFGAHLFSNCGKHTLGKVGEILVKTSSIGKWREVLCSVQGKIMLNKNFNQSNLHCFLKYLSSKKKVGN